MKSHSQKQDIVELVNQGYEAQLIGLCKWHMNEQKRLRQLLASKGRLKGGALQSAEFKLLIEFVKKQAEAFCSILLKYYTSFNEKISDEEKAKYKEKLENILGRLKEDIQSVNIVKDEARLNFESICSMINYNIEEECIKNKDEIENDESTLTGKDKLKENLKKGAKIVYDESKDFAAKVLGEMLKK